MITRKDEQMEFDIGNVRASCYSDGSQTIVTTYPIDVYFSEDDYINEDNTVGLLACEFTMCDEYTTPLTAESTWEFDKVSIMRLVDIGLTKKQRAELLDVCVAATREK